MQRFLFFISGLVFCLTGCTVPTTMSMEGVGGRNSYNIAVQESNSEEMLLNLVRLRYFDSPLFLEVNNITTQVTYKTSAGTAFTIPGFSKQRPVGFSGDMSWQNQPTIQYSPLEGQEFATQLLQPIEIKTLQQLIYSGWDIDRLFRLVVQSFSDLLNMPLGVGPVPPNTPRYRTFFEVT